MIVAVITSWTCPCGKTSEGTSMYDATIRVRQTAMTHILGARPKSCGSGCRMHEVGHPDRHRLHPDDAAKVVAAWRALRDRNAARYVRRKEARP